MATRLYFVRHGETDWNVEGRLQGQLDIPLNDHGRKQAHAAATYLKHHHSVDLIYL
jgi:broad specificity phosphatase PhoE